MHTSASVSFADPDPNAFRQMGAIPVISMVFLSIQAPPVCAVSYKHNRNICVFPHYTTTAKLYYWLVYIVSLYKLHIWSYLPALSLNKSLF